MTYPVTGLPLHAYFWRKQSLHELQKLSGQLKSHAKDIRALQEKLSRRIIGIEEAVTHLDQAAAVLEATPDATRGTTGKVYTGKPRGRPKSGSKASGSKARAAAE